MSRPITLDEAREQFRALPGIQSATAYLEIAMDYEARGIVRFTALGDIILEIGTWLQQKGILTP